MNIIEGLASQLWCEEKQQGNFQPQYSKETGYINMNKISICQEYFAGSGHPESWLNILSQKTVLPTWLLFSRAFPEDVFRSSPHWVWDLVSYFYPGKNNKPAFQFGSLSFCAVPSRELFRIWAKSKIFSEFMWLFLSFVPFSETLVTQHHASSITPMHWVLQAPSWAFYYLSHYFKIHDCVQK